MRSVLPLLACVLIGAQKVTKNGERDSLALHIGSSSQPSGPSSPITERESDSASNPTKRTLEQSEASHQLKWKRPKSHAPDEIDSEVVLSWTVLLEQLKRPYNIGRKVSRAAL